MIVAEKNQPYNHYSYQGNLARQIEPLQLPEQGKKPERKLHHRIPVFFTLALLTAVAVVLVTLAAVTFSTQLQINGMKEDLAALQAENENLELELANLSSMDRLEAIALNQLGLVYPTDSQQVILSRR